MARATSPRDVSRTTSLRLATPCASAYAARHAIRRDEAHTASDRLPICAIGANTAATKIRFRNHTKKSYKIQRLRRNAIFLIFFVEEGLTIFFFMMP